MISELNEAPVAWVRQQISWNGDLPVAFFERLPDEDIAYEMPLSIALKGVKTAKGHLALLFGFNTRIAQTCQRCLMPVSTDLAKTRLIVIVTSQIAYDQLDTLLDEDEDAVQSSGITVPKTWKALGIPTKLEGMDVMLASDYDKLNTLIEDEVMMALPIVPTHAHCPDPEVYQHILDSNDSVD